MSWTSVLLTIAVALTWLTIVGLAFGVGAMFLKALVRLDDTWADAFLATLCGFALVFAVLLAWHFFLPVDWRASAGFAAVGVTGLIRERAWLSALLRGRSSKLHSLPILIFLVWAANHALMTGGWDDYLYEFQAIRWFHDYPIVPGLANLHGRLGFNTSHHLYAAMLSIGSWSGAVNLLVNGPFVALTFALAWCGCAELLRGHISERNVFTAAFIAPCIARYLVITDPAQPTISTLKADVAAAALAIVCACLWLELMDRTTTDRRRQALAVTLVLTAATLFTIRVSAGAFVAILMIAAMVSLGRGLASRRLLVPVAAVSAVLVLAVPIRGIVLSGYPFYPSPVLAAAVDWRVPLAQTQVERTFITTYAQVRSANFLQPPEGEWISNWARTSLLLNRVTVTLPLALVCTLVPLLILTRASGPSTLPVRAWLVLWSATAGVLVVWWLHAPGFRFVWGQLWILIASLLAKASQRVAPRALFAWPAVSMAGAIAATIWVFRLPRSEVISLAWPPVFAAVWSTVFLVTQHRRGLVGPLVVALGLYPIVDRVSADLVYGRLRDMKGVFWLDTTSMPRVTSDFRFTERTTFSGLTIYEAAPLTRYENPLPSTPYFNRYLELRRPPDLRGGFRNTRQDAYPLFGYKPGERMAVPDE